MATATTTVTCNAQGYTQLTTASTGYALIYNPIDAGGNLAIYNGSAAPDASTEAMMVLLPDDAFPRISDITDHLWGKVMGEKDIKVVVTE